MVEESVSNKKFFTIARFKKWAKRLLIGCVVLLAVGLLVRGILVWHAQGLVDEEIAAIRAKGEPLNPDDLRAINGYIPINDNGAHYFKFAQKLKEGVNESWESKTAPKYNPLYKSIRTQIVEGKGREENGEKIDEEKVAEIEKYLNELQEPNEILKKGLQKKHFVFDLKYEDDFGMEMGHLSFARAFGRDNLARAVLAARKGDSAKTTEILLVCGNIAKILDQEPILISYLVSVAITRLQLQGIEFCLEHIRFSKKQLQDIRIAAKERLQKKQFKSALYGERVFGIKAYRRILKGYPLEGENVHTNFLEKTARWIAKPYFLYDHHSYLMMFRQILKTTEDPNLQISSVAGVEEPDYLLAALILPVLTRTDEAHLQLQSKAVAMEIALKLLEAFNGDVSQLPKDPERLGAAIQDVGGMPKDPFGKNGELLKLKVTKEYILIYGMGGDLKDDGGGIVGDKDIGFFVPLQLRNPASGEVKEVLEKEGKGI